MFQKGIRRREKGCFCCKFSHKGRPENKNATNDELTLVDAMVHLKASSLIDSALFCPESRTIQASHARDVATAAKRKAAGIIARQSDEEGRKLLSSVAPLRTEEVRLGALLGVGGFSRVYEVRGFPLSTEASGIDPRQQKARDFLSLHALKKKEVCIESLSREGEDVLVDGLDASFSILEGDVEDTVVSPAGGRRKPMGRHSSRKALASDSKRSNSSSITDVLWRSSSVRDGDDDDSLEDSATAGLVSRYVMKHLKPELMDSPKDFLLAACDLVSEAQLLLCLEHPNIARLRGWSMAGPGGYRTGQHNAFFIICDRLFETLLDRTYSWRRQWKSIHRNGSRNVADVPSRYGTRILSWRKKHQRAEEEDALDENLQELLLKRLAVAHDIACALEYLHEKRIVYRDLKPTNIGFDINEEVKIFDFGLARYLPPPVTHLPNEVFAMNHAGTDGYVAPEVYTEQYNAKADVYSFAVVFWEMMSLCSRDEWVDGTFSPCPCWSPPIQALLTKMVDPQPDRRANMSTVRKCLHSIIRDIPAINETSKEFFLTQSQVALSCR